MARDGAVYACQSCGAVTTKWSGQCSACQSWNSLVEETGVRAPGALSVTKASRARGLQFTGLESDTPAPPRIITGVDEFDRVCGGGVVPGSAILIGGDPGVGKSTLLLEVVAKASLKGVNCAYISGEEAVAQIRGRAERMGFAQAPVKLAAESSLRDILDGLKRDNFDLVVIDSIQTMWSDAHEAGPGTVTQVRACAQELVRLAKKKGVAILLVGHVTKDGQIAGPRVVEHLVDAVLSFEGERGYPFRILRGAKNRFGATDEIGVFEMGDSGLREVKNPSALFLNEGGERAAGAAVFAGIEGSRPVLVEFQALVAPSAYGTPRRAVVGWDSGRLAMVLAVLESRCGLGFGNKDVYLNVAGGLRITEPAADLAAAAALASSALDIALPQDCVVFGEVSLSGEVRPVSRMETRLKEAAKLGFGRALGPLSGLPEGGGALPVAGVARLADAVRRIGDEIWGQLDVTPFDIIFGLILLVSALVGFARGASRELTSALSFIVAALLSLLALRVSGPLFRGMMDPDWAATAAAILVVFVIIFVLLRLVGSQITKTLHADGALGTLDRLMGLAFGVARGLVVLGVFSLVFHMATPPDRVPSWMSKSALYPLSNAAGRVLKVFAPKGAGLAGKLAPAIEDAVQDGASDKPSDRKPGDPGYDKDQRRSVDDLVEKSR